MDTAVGSPHLIRAFRLALQVGGLRPHTIANYVRDAERFARFKGEHPLGSSIPDDVRSFIAAFQIGHSPKTVHETQLGLRRFFRFLVAEGELDSDPTERMKLVRYRVEPQPTYSEQEVRQLLSACDASNPAGMRNRALVTTLFDTGVRAGELVSMQVPSWDRRIVRVDGKTGVRQVPLGNATIQAIERYCRRWGIVEGVLWRGKKGPLTGSGVFQLVRRLCRRAGVEDKGVHAFRRAAAAQMKRLGMNDSDILEIMGWKDVTMLRRYTAAVASELAQLAHEKCSPADAMRGR